MRSTLLAFAALAGCSHAPRTAAPANRAPVAAAAATLEHAPDAADCKRRLEAAAAEFAHDVPASYPPYNVLDFSPREVEAEPGDIAAIDIVPGRSWRLRAHVMSPDVRDAPDDTTATWTDALTDEGVTHARRARTATLLLTVNSDRWGDYAPLEHPLVKLFFAKLGPAADSCVGA